VVLAGGCFWGVEDLLRKVPGILDTEVGYCGGTSDNPKYETVKMGSTGHAESVSLTFDPKVISLARILELFFQMHDPTTLNRQGQDVGSQYRSTIFVSSAQQRAVAETAIKNENQAKRWPRPVVTTVENLTAFYSAEVEHQDYLQKNPGGYTCHFWRGLGPG
jgi:methionine-S-sulfoxide reductase